MAQVHGASDVRLDFHSAKTRDEVISHLQSSSHAARAALALRDPSSASLANLSLHRSSSDGSRSSTPTSPVSPYSMPPLRSTFQGERTHVLGENVIEDVRVDPSFKKPAFHVLGVGPMKVAAQHYVLLTIGSRGDVQPYIALGIELLKDGNRCAYSGLQIRHWDLALTISCLCRVTIASHPEYRHWVESYGIEYKEVGGDPAALMKLSVEHKMFSPGFFSESLGHFRGWLDRLVSPDPHSGVPRVMY